MHVSWSKISLVTLGVICRIPVVTDLTEGPDGPTYEQRLDQLNRCEEARAPRCASSGRAPLRLRDWDPSPKNI